MVRGLEAVVEELAASGVGKATRRVLAGGGTVIVCVCTTVLIWGSYATSETIKGGSSLYCEIIISYVQYQVIT